MERYLITTAIKETWRYDPPLVFLGDWCLSIGDKEQLTGVDYVIQDYHWNDRDVLYQDYLYLKKLYIYFTERFFFCYKLYTNHLFILLVLKIYKNGGKNS